MIHHPLVELALSSRVVGVVQDVLEQIGPRIRRIKDDPAFLELAQDPAVGAALESGNSLALFSDPRFRDLVNRALEDPPSGLDGAPSGQDGEGGQPGR